MNINSSRILVVDNDPKFLDLILRILKDLPHEITTAKTAEEALNLLINKDEFPLVISNYYMGKGMNGGEFLKLVKKHSPRTIKILITAGLNEDALLEKQAKGELDSFTNKPILFQNFIAQIENSIKEYNKTI